MASILGTNHTFSSTSIPASPPGSIPAAGTSTSDWSRTWDAAPCLG